MTDPRLSELLNGEIDGELDAQQRAELSRRLLANAEARAMREEFRRVCAALDAVPQVAPPPELSQGVLAALPQRDRTAGPPRGGWRSNASFIHGWRYAALFAGVVVGGAVVFHTVRGPGPADSELAGTIATGALDTARLEGPVSGTVALFRAGNDLNLRVDVSASAPVRLVIATDGQQQGNSPAPVAESIHRTIPLTGLAVHGQSLELTFLQGEHPVAGARLRLPEAP
jgi:anti-sigma factor RsiW